MKDADPIPSECHYKNKIFRMVHCPDGTPVAVENIDYQLLRVLNDLKSWSLPIADDELDG